MKRLLGLLTCLFLIFCSNNTEKIEYKTIILEKTEPEIIIEPTECTLELWELGLEGISNYAIIENEVDCVGGAGGEANL